PAGTLAGDPSPRPRLEASRAAGHRTPPTARDEAMILGCGKRHKGMSSVTCQISISLDGFIAGPNQSLENPIGEGGMRLHQWLFETPSWREQHGEEGGPDTTDSKVVRALFTNGGGLHHGRQDVRGRGGPVEGGRNGWVGGR